MIAYGKTVATAAGFILGGPVGGVLAYGAAIAAEKIMEPDEDDIITDGMLAYLFACLGKVAVADGEISEDEEYNLNEILEDYNLIKILTNISGKTGQNGSNSAEIGSVKKEPKNRLEPPSLQGLASKRVFETLVEVAGIETGISK